MCEWKNWKTIQYPNIRMDTHRAEIVDIDTGEVLEDNMMKSSWDDLVNYEVNFCHRKRNYYRSLRIYRMDIGDAFCSVDWSKY